MSKRNRNTNTDDATMSTESQETQEQSQPIDLTVETPAAAPEQEAPAQATEPAPVITQEAEVETPTPEKKAEDAAKAVTVNAATKATARIAQKPASNSNLASLQSTNPRVRQFAFQANQYIALCKQPCTTEPAMRKKLEQFTYIIRVIINSTDPAVYEAAFQFFKNYRTNILSENTVFQYIHVLPTELSIRVQTIYTTFTDLVAAVVDQKPFRLDYGLIRDNMKLPAQHPLLNWIRNRLEK